MAAWRGIMLLALLAAAPVGAQPISTSPAPDSVSVTIYRAPHRAPDGELDLEWLEGYALITETRRVSIPAGEADLRFEGVAGGIIPESAIVTGLPTGVVEKNQDAYLLSPASLLDRSLGKRVHIRRTSKKTGAVTEEEAVIRSGAGGAVVLQTRNGFEALRCTGLSEKIVYPSVPEGLSAKPTLSVRTRSDRAATATVTLSYLASGFDWQANYVARLTPAGDRLDLFAWVTIANGDETSFANASTQTVAGRVNREDEERRSPPTAEGLQLRCWPAGRTSDIPLRKGEFPPPPAPPPVVAFDVAAEDGGEGEIVVTGARMARQEELGDLKLYRIPEPVTVASRSQKQVAFLEKEAVRFGKIYRSSIESEEDDESEPLEWILRFENRKEDGLGVPLPGGRLVLFDDYRGRPILLGEGAVHDSAIQETVEIPIAKSEQVRSQVQEIEERSRKDGERLFEAVVTNSGSAAASVELSLDLYDSEKLLSSSAKLGRKNGRPLWKTIVPAGGRSVLRYRIGRADTEEETGS
jgi:hypothetical protein